MIERERLRAHYRRGDNACEAERLATWLLQVSGNPRREFGDIAASATANGVDPDALDVLARACSIARERGLRW
jgi:hypothetical protein